MIKNSVGRGVIILAISSIILKILSALYMPFLSQILTDKGYAIYTVGYDIFVFLFAITSLSMQPVVTKLVAEQRANGSNENAFRILKISRNIMFIYGSLVSILFALLAKPLSILFNSEQSMMVFVFLSPAILFAAILSAYRGFLQGCNEMIVLSVSNIIEQLLNVVFSLFFAFQLMKLSISWGSTGGTIGTTLGAIGALIYIRYVLYKRYAHKVTLQNTVEEKSSVGLNSKHIIKTLFLTAIPFILIAGIQNIVGVIDVFTVKRIIASGSDMKIATLKYFTTIINVPLVIITSLGIGIFPKVIKGYVEKNKKELMIQTSYCYKITYIITMPSVCGLMILSKDIFKFVFNRGFGHEIFLIGSISLIFIALSTIQNIVLQGMNKLKFIIRLGLTSLLIKIVCNIIFINIDSINVAGAVIGSIISVFTVTVVNHINLQKYFNVKVPILKQSIKPLMASVIMGVVLILLRYQFISKFIEGSYKRINIGMITLGLVIIGGIIYSLSLLLLGGVSKYELDTLSPKIYKLLPNGLKKKVVKVK